MIPLGSVSGSVKVRKKRDQASKVLESRLLNILGVTFAVAKNRVFWCFLELPNQIRQRFRSKTFSAGLSLLATPSISSVRARGVLAATHDLYHGKGEVHSPLGLS